MSVIGFVRRNDRGMDIVREERSLPCSAGCFVNVQFLFFRSGGERSQDVKHTEVYSDGPTSTATSKVSRAVIKGRPFVGTGSDYKIENASWPQVHVCKVSYKGISRTEFAGSLDPKEMQLYAYSYSYF